MKPVQAQAHLGHPLRALETIFMRKISYYFQGLLD
jgi:hypothetical protein